MAASSSSSVSSSCRSLAVRPRPSGSRRSIDFCGANTAQYTKTQTHQPRASLRGHTLVLVGRSHSHLAHRVERRVRVRADGGGGFDRLNASLENAWGKVWRVEFHRRVIVMMMMTTACTYIHFNFCSQLQGLTELTEENTKEPLRDIRRSLLEADVSLPVVRRFVKRVQERAKVRPFPSLPKTHMGQ